MSAWEPFSAIQPNIAKLEVSHEIVVLPGMVSTCLHPFAESRTLFIKYLMMFGIRERVFRAD